MDGTWCKVGSMVMVVSLNVDVGSTGLDQVMQKRKLALESHLYPFTSCLIVVFLPLYLMSIFN